MWLQNLNRQDAARELTDRGMSINQARETVENAADEGVGKGTVSNTEYTVWLVTDGIYDIKA